jgi:3-phosphoshikimate 1-carboxyvinyltransferase
MCAALARGQSKLLRPLSSDDTEAALRVLGQIGVQAELGKNDWQITGNGLHSPTEDLFCGDSAATLRFMSAICALVPGTSRLTAGPTLSRRPVKTLVDALKMWGIEISCQGEVAPVVVKGGRFKGGITELPGDISSQYVSALLLIAPLAETNTQIRLTTTLESSSYVLMTLECLRKFGVQIKYSEYLREFETYPQVYKPARYRVEGDWSSASYLLGMGAVAGETTVENLNSQSLQGDRAIVALLRDMNASIEVNNNWVRVKKNKLKAIKANLNDCIDILPTVAVLAALAQGTSEFFGIQRARLKESNRITAVKEGLERTGIKVVEEPDRFIVTGGKPKNANIDSRNDHRIAMAFSLLGAAAGGITIEGAECVSKTFPAYWDTLRKLGVKLNEQ